ncbi:hypothetical protein TcYC6_0097500 [Trypanosoma cruzi]|nr:hypothetical protein TcYC6_0097500 [Trypanosoma cruzi]
MACPEEEHWLFLNSSLHNSINKKSYGGRAKRSIFFSPVAKAYWGRVLQLYHEEIPPYVDVVKMKKHILLQSL